MLVDTDVLIWYLRGYPKAAQFLDGLAVLRLSAVSYMELVQGCRNKEELSRLKKDLSIRDAAVLPITEAISGRAVALIESHALGDGLQMADALIAATSLEHDLPLASGNSKHFGAVSGLRLETFQP
jgi:predicted nucleic acid-binding protein